MKLSESILLSVLVFLFVVGLDQIMRNGFVKSYWIFMLVIMFLGIYKLVKRKNNDNQKKNVE